MDSPGAGNPFPGGSPTAATASAGDGAGLTGMDGIEVARRMVQAAEAAALAAQAATAAMQEASAASRSTADEGRQWWKLLPKPPTEQRDRDLSMA